MPSGLLSFRVLEVLRERIPSSGDRRLPREPKKNAIMLTMGQRITSAWRSLRQKHSLVLAVVVGGIVIYVLFGLLLWWSLDKYIQLTDSTKEKVTIEAFLVFIMAGVAGGVGIYFMWRSLQQGKEEQVTEQFTRAIYQLRATDGSGNKCLEIRLCGIYTLEHIAKASDRDYWPVMKLLTAYIRENAPWLPKKPLQEDDLGLFSQFSHRQQACPNTPDQVDISTPDSDVQAILGVLRRRAHYFGRGESEYLDLHRTDLRGTILWGANLQRAFLAGANLQRAFLHEANLKKAVFWKADLERANFFKANLGGADLAGANLRGAILTRANLGGTRLWRANLRGALLSEANLEKAVNLTQEQINEAKGDETTKLPGHLQRPAHWKYTSTEEGKN